MKFDKKINHLVDAIDDVLISLGQPKLIENPDFVFGELSCESWLDARFERRGAVDLRFIVASSEIRIDIDRAEETYHIDPSIYQNNFEVFRALVRMIFTCKIRVECCGKHYTRIDFFDDNNQCTDTIKHSTSLFNLKLNCTTKEYPPIYEA